MSIVSMYVTNIPCVAFNFTCSVSDAFPLRFGRSGTKFAASRSLSADDQKGSAAEHVKFTTHWFLLKQRHYFASKLAARCHLDSKLSRFRYGVM